MLKPGVNKERMMKAGRGKLPKKSGGLRGR